MQLKHAVCAIVGLAISGAIAGPIQAAEPAAEAAQRGPTTFSTSDHTEKVRREVVEDIDAVVLDPLSRLVRREPRENDVFDLQGAKDEIQKRSSAGSVDDRNMRKVFRREDQTTEEANVPVHQGKGTIPVPERINKNKGKPVDVSYDNGVVNIGGESITLKPRYLNFFNSVVTNPSTNDYVRLAELQQCVEFYGNLRNC